MNKFKKNLKKFRLEKNMTQKELGMMLDRTDTVIAKMESGERYPSFDFMVKFHKVFPEINMNEFLFGIYKGGELDECSTGVN